MITFEEIIKEVKISSGKIDKNEIIRQVNLSIFHKKDFQKKDLKNKCK